jgi:hypothetical protein
VHFAVGVPVLALGVRAVAGGCVEVAAALEVERTEVPLLGAPTWWLPVMVDWMRSSVEPPATLIATAGSSLLAAVLSAMVEFEIVTAAEPDSPPSSM